MPARAQSTRRRTTQAARADRHRLYEASVQDAAAELDFVEAEFERLRDRPAYRLREDFCGSASVATEWVRRHRRHVAIGVDLDDEVLAWAKERHVSRLTPGQRARLDLRRADVMRVKTPPQDLVLAMNFSYWIFKTRAQVRAYFAAVRGALVKDGAFMLDCFGGYDAFRVLEEPRQLRGFTYIWDQASYNPVNGDFRAHIHFRFPDGSKLREAFTYEWRLWTLPELRELLAEAGFKRSIVYWQGWDAKAEDGDGVYQPVESADPDAGWISYIVALK